MKARRFIDILLFKAYADIRAERERTYLGFLWWIFEPLTYMLVLWLAFDVILSRGGEGFVLFVLVGLVPWQWFKSTVTHGANSVLGARKLIQQVALPPVLFPLVTIMTDAAKFSVVLVLLLAVLMVTGEGRSLMVLALPAVLLTELALICAATLWIAAVVPFLPDLRIVTETILTALMFLSGIFFSGRELPEPVRSWFFLNPVAFLLDQVRAVLLMGVAPDWKGLATIFFLSVLAALAAAAMIRRLSRHYPKLPV